MCALNKLIKYDGMIGLIAIFAITSPIVIALSERPAFFVASGSSSVVMLITLALMIIIPQVFVMILSTVTYFKGGIIIRIAISTAFLCLYWAANSLAGWPMMIAGVFTLVVVVLIYRLLEKNQSIKKLINSLVMYYGVILTFWVIFFSQAGKMLHESELENIKSPLSNGISVTVVVFDEMSYSALLNNKSIIDEQKFPNFYKLSMDGIMFTNAISNSASTRTSIPTILTGTHVDAADGRAAVSGNYPINLLTEADKHFYVNSHEPTSSMCPRVICSNKNKFDIENYIADNIYIVLNIILPKKLVAGMVPSIDVRLHDFGLTDNGGSDMSIHEGDGFRQMIASIKANKGPQFNFIHITRPHIPYERIPDGRTYNNNIGIFPAGIERESDGWVGSDDLIKVAYHRYLLQVGYVDKILGVIIEGLKEANIYDDGVVIVTSDHGVAFVKGENRRDSIKSGNIKEVHNVPLIIKPHKNSVYANPGLIREDVISHIDIAPTLSKLIGIEMMSNVEGISAFGFDYGLRKIPIDGGRFVVGVGDISGFDRLEWSKGVFESSVDLMSMSRIDGINGKLNNSRVSVWGAESVSDSYKVSVDNQILKGLSMVDRAGFSQLRIYGNLIGGGNLNNKFIAISLNGIIRSVAKTSSWKKIDGYFEAIIPPSVILSNGNDIEFYYVESNSNKFDSFILKKLKKNN